VLDYHGCDRVVGERLLRGAPFRPSDNEYDWLGPGIYFWEANPLRGFEYAIEAAEREPTRIIKPFVVGAIIELGFCLDLTTKAGIEMVRSAYESLVETSQAANVQLPGNSADKLRRPLDCAVIRRLHSIAEETGPFDTVRGVFTEGGPIHPGAGLLEKTHIQIAVLKQACVKGVFRVPENQLRTTQLIRSNEKNREPDPRSDSRPTN
jgi:hypothetical protein